MPSIKKFINLFVLFASAQVFYIPALIAAENELSVSTGPGTMDLVQVLVGLVTVVLFIVLLSVILRRMNIVPGASNKLITILGGIAITNKDRLLLIQVGDEQILVSASQGNINKIHKMKNPVEVPDSATNAGSSGKGFLSLLEKYSNTQKHGKINEN